MMSCLGRTVLRAVLSQTLRDICESLDASVELICSGRSDSYDRQLAAFGVAAVNGFTTHPWHHSRGLNGNRKHFSLGDTQQESRNQAYSFRKNTDAQPGLTIVLCG